MPGKCVLDAFDPYRRCSSDSLVTRVAFAHTVAPIRKRGSAMGNMNLWNALGRVRDYRNNEFAFKDGSHGQIVLLVNPENENYGKILGF